MQQTGNEQSFGMHKAAIPGQTTTQDGTTHASEPKTGYIAQFAGDTRKLVNNASRDDHIVEFFNTNDSNRPRHSINAGLKAVERTVDNPKPTRG